MLLKLVLQEERSTEAKYTFLIRNLVVSNLYSSESDINKVRTSAKSGPSRYLTHLLAVSFDHGKSILNKCTNFFVLTYLIREAQKVL